MGFPGGSVVKNPPAKQETWVRSLGREDLLEKEMATHSSILTWEIPWTEEPGGLQSLGSQRIGHNWTTCTAPHYSFTFIKRLFSSSSLSAITVVSSAYLRASLVAQMVKNLPAMQETQLWSLGWEDPLEKEMATHSSILTWEIPWRKECGELQSMGLQRVGED